MLTKKIMNGLTVADSDGLDVGISYCRTKNCEGRALLDYSKLVNSRFVDLFPSSGLPPALQQKVSC